MGSFSKPHAPIEEEAAGEAGSTQQCRAVSLIDAQAVAGPPPEWVAEAYRILQEIPGLKIELLTCSNTDGWSVPLPLCGDEDGVIDDRLLIPNGELGRPRRAAAFQIFAEIRPIIVVVIEAVEPMKVSYSSSQDSKIDLVEALSRAAIEYLGVSKQAAQKQQ